MENLVFSLKFFFKLIGVILTGSGSADDTAANNFNNEIVNMPIIQQIDSINKPTEPTLVLDSLAIKKDNYEKQVKLATDGI